MAKVRTCIAYDIYIASLSAVLQERPLNVHNISVPATAIGNVIVATPTPFVCSKQYADTYEEAEANYYSPDVITHLCNRKANSAQVPGLNRSKVELRAQLYNVTQIAAHKKVGIFLGFSCQFL